MLSELFVTHIGIRQDVICERYVEKLPVVRHLRKTDGLDITNRITILVGENGMGKSTLIEAIAVNLGFNPEGGTRNFQFATEDTHSPMLMALPGAEVLQLTNKGIAPVNYQDTEHFTLMRAFLNDPERYLGYLFEDEEVEDD